jgi:hypothetical protein
MVGTLDTSISTNENRAFSFDDFMYLLVLSSWFIMYLLYFNYYLFHS